MLTDEQAESLVAHSEFLWHQKFALSDHVVSPGTNDIGWLIDQVGLPERLDGLSVLDVGTTNGGAAFLAERRGAKRVVAVDIYGPERFGFNRIKAALGSDVEFVQGTIYQLPEVLEGETFDEVLFLGVLYHLRHPLLAIDSLHRLTRRHLYVETAVSGLPDDEASARFFRRDELAGDSSNWFAPTVRCLVDWVESSGFVVEGVSHWPEGKPSRASVAARPAVASPEYSVLSYEVPLRVLPDAMERGDSL